MIHARSAHCAAVKPAVDGNIFRTTAEMCSGPQYRTEIFQLASDIAVSNSYTACHCQRRFHTNRRKKPRLQALSVTSNFMSQVPSLTHSGTADDSIATSFLTNASVLSRLDKALQVIKNSAVERLLVAKHRIPLSFIELTAALSRARESVASSVQMLTLTKSNKYNLVRREELETSRHQSFPNDVFQFKKRYVNFT